MERRKKKKRKEYFKPGIIGYIQKILAMVTATILVVFILSLFMDAEFIGIYKFATLGILIVGLLSIIGGTSITHNPAYYYHKSMTGMVDTRKEDLGVLQGSYSFFIFMSITAGILYLISLLF